MKLAAQHMKRPQMHISAAIPLQHMVDEAVTFIREHEPSEGYFVAFSGGKDSIVTLELTRMAGVKHQAFYSATGIDPPEVVQFIRKYYSDVKWLRPKITFWDGIQRNGPPLKNRRWCCDVLKKDASVKVGFQCKITGIRSEESFKRALRPRVQHPSKKRKHIKPIFHWKTWHVWEFLESKSIAYPSLYDAGFERIG